MVVTEFFSPSQRPTDFDVSLKGETPFEVKSVRVTDSTHDDVEIDDLGNTGELPSYSLKTLIFQR